MNYKNLNYEIETSCYPHLRSADGYTMNYKNLNYEIETRISFDIAVAASSAMNYKNLNYEIETSHLSRYVSDTYNYEL